MYNDKDRREAKQIEIRNEYGELEQTVIPSYVKKDYFITGNEFKFLRALEEIYKNNSNIKIFVQVALNAIITINNNRAISELNNFKFNERSIDFVIYDSSKDSYGILYCVELNGEEHYDKSNKIELERDRKIKNIFDIAGIQLFNIKQSDIELDKNEFFKTDSVKRLLNLK